MYLLARNEEINQWLEEHPAVLGGIFLVLGTILLLIGIRALVTGRARTKHGKQVEGPIAYVQGGVMSLVGSFLLVFSLIKLASAVF